MVPAPEVVVLAPETVVPAPEVVVPAPEEMVDLAPDAAAKVEVIEASAVADSALQEDSPTQAKKKKSFFSKGKRLFKRLGSSKKE